MGLEEDALAVVAARKIEEEKRLAGEPELKRLRKEAREKDVLDYAQKQLWEWCKRTNVDQLPEPKSVRFSWRHGRWGWDGENPLRVVTCNLDFELDGHLFEASAETQYYNEMELTDSDGWLKTQMSPRQFSITIRVDGDYPRRNAWSLETIGEAIHARRLARGTKSS
jgi:hypothetical protein